MKPRTHATILVLFLCSLFICVAVWAKGPNYSETYPRPITEMEDVISGWLRRSGFNIFRTGTEVSQVCLSAQIREEEWNVVLIQQSPLATRVMIRKSSSGKINSNLLNQLRSYISAYINELGNEAPRIAANRINGSQNNISESPNVSDGNVPDIQQSIPHVVLSQIDSVVCIEARVAGEELQFSGFIIDEHSIICTAHDFINPEFIRVVFHDGTEMSGNIKKIDVDRDLALIEIDKKLDRFILLSNGRNLRKKGERLYSISCPMNQKRTVFPGSYEYPVRLDEQGGLVGNDLILWLVQMKIFPGSSGSPVFDEQGDLVGVVKGKYRRNDSLGFLIPFETILEFMQEK